MRFPQMYIFGDPIEWYLLNSLKALASLGRPVGASASLVLDKIALAHFKDKLHNSMILEWIVFVKLF